MNNQAQTVRFVNYGTSLENLNLTTALQAVGVRALDVAKNDIVYIVYEEKGKMLCSARGVLSKEIALNSFKWPQEQKYTSIWQIAGDLQFCEPFDLSVLKSQRDAAQYVWFIQNEAKINNERILFKLSELFEENLKTDGDIMLHDSSQKKVVTHTQATKKSNKFDKFKFISKFNLLHIKTLLLKYYTMFNLWLRDEPISKVEEQFKTTDHTVQQTTIEEQQEIVDNFNDEEDSPIDEEAVISTPALSHVQKIPSARHTDFNKVYAQNNKQSAKDIDLEAITAKDLKLEFSRVSQTQNSHEITEDESKFLDSLNELESAHNKQSQRSPEDFFNE